MDVQNHLQAEKACQPKKPFEDGRGYNKVKEELLNKRMQRGGTGQEKWIDIYKILFPRDPEWRIPDPCKSFVRAIICYVHLTAYQITTVENLLRQHQIMPNEDNTLATKYNTL